MHFRHALAFLILLAFSSLGLHAEAPLRVFIRSGPKTHGPGAHDHPRFLAEWTALLAERGILDGGSKTFSSDLLGLEGHGLIVEYPEARFYGMSEEHGHVDFSACARKPELGERVTVIPNHCCPVANLFNQLVGVRGGSVEVVWPVAARGALQ